MKGIAKSFCLYFSYIKSEKAGLSGFFVWLKIATVKEILSVVKEILTTEIKKSNKKTRHN